MWLEAIERHAAERPDALAIAEIGPDGGAGRATTNGRLLELMRSQTAALAGLIGEGGAVIAALPSGIDLAGWFGAAVASGVRLVLVHPDCAHGELRAVAAKTGATAVIARGNAANVIDGPWGVLDGAASTSAVATENHRVPGSIVLGSSGTTGMPKLVLRESSALDADAAGVALGMGLTMDDTVLCVPPMCHSYGVDILLGTLFAGASLNVMTEFCAAGVAAQLGAGVTVLPGVPFLYESLARIERPRDLRVRIALSAGSPLSERVRRALQDRWHMEIGQLYGATELGTVAIGRPDEPGFDPLSIGRPLPGVSFRVLDPQDSTVQLPIGMEGHLAVRAPSMLSGYIDGDVPVADGHLLTGDLARLDATGRATITGRLKLLIDVGGFKVNPLEVEAALREHPRIADSVVGPLALSDTVQRVRACIEPRDAADPPDARDLREFLKDRLSAHKIPRVFDVVESLPRSPLGKVLRDRLPGNGC